MAQITAATLQTTLDSTNTRKAFLVTKGFNQNATYDWWYVLVGVYQATNPTLVPGRARWCRSTIANTAADQATEVITALAG